MSNPNVENSHQLSPEQSLIETITDNLLSDTAVDIAEIGLDQLLNNLQDGIIEEIPVIKSFYSLFKTGVAIRDYQFLKKILLFISSSDNTDDNFKKRLKEKMDDPDSKQKLSEDLFNSLSLLDQLSKSKALFKIFSAYIKDEIDYKKFSQYCHVLQNIDFNNLEILSDFYDTKKVRKNENILQSFLSQGLVTIDFSSRKETVENLSDFVSFPGKIERNQFGAIFLKILGLRATDNVPRDVKELAKLNSIENHNNRIIKQMLKNEWEAKREWFDVIYEGRDVESGLYKVKTKIGNSVLYSNAKSIPGSIRKGSSLIAFLPPGSSYVRLLTFL